MPSKIGVLIRCYSITDYLPLVLKNYAWVDKIVVMNYRFTSAEPREDKTEEIVRAFKHKDITVEKGEGIKQHEIFNRGLKLMADCKLAFISDADEFLTPAAMQDIAFKTKEGDYGLGYARIIDYAFDYYHRFDNRHLNHALVAVIPKYAEFVKIRIARSSKKSKFFDHHLYHFGFVLPHKTMQWKLKWESKEEGLDIVKGITQTHIVLCSPPEHEIMQLLEEI